MEHFLQTDSGVKISIEHLYKLKKSAVIIAPGFFASKSTPVFKQISNDLSVYFDIISMDFRGHGSSSGFFTFSAWEKEDLKAVIDYARKYYRRVGVLGFSYGGTIAIIEQAEFQNIDSLICVSSPMASEKIEFHWWKRESIKSGIRSLRWGARMPRLGNPFLPKVRPLDIVSSLQIPIFFMHGTSDPTVSLKHSEILYERSHEPKKLKIFEKASHADEIYRRFPFEFIEETKSWFAMTLKN